MLRLGRYSLEHAIARGGMAEVYLAKVEGPAGFAKSVVIKRILPELAFDRKFVELFLDEARLAALLNHPNIVQVFDFGEQDGSYYLAMEYIEGETLRNALRYFANRGERFPAPLAAFLVAGLCEGLHYAHELSDASGVSYNVIHRDISPENVIIARTGTPKIVDFGIAKAANRQTATETGVIRGKYAYMPPEQLRARNLDRRADIYALGVTLYEMVTMRRPYESESDVAVIAAALEGHAITASEVAPDVPKALSDIIATAMAPDRDARFATARAFKSALRDYLAGTNARVGSDDLADLVSEVTRSRRMQQGVLSSGPKAIPGFPPEGANAGQGSAMATAATSPVAPRIDAQPISAASALRAQLRRRSRLAAFGFLSMAVLVAVLALLPGGGMPIAPSGDTTIEIRETAPAPAAPVLAPDPPKEVEPEPVAPAPSRPARVRAERKPRPAPVAVATPTPPPSDPLPPPPPPPAPTPGVPGTLTLRTDPWTEVFHQGRRLGATPLAKVQLPAGVQSLQLRNDGAGIRRDVELEIPSGQELKKTIIFPRGIVSIQARPWADVTMNGVKLGRTPLAAVEMVEGQHELAFENAELGKRTTRQVRVEAGRRQTVEVFWE